METVFIDGSTGEGGGQILRTSLALACITGKALHIENIRAARRNPGLAKQHLSCVHAASQICNARCDGAALNSRTLDFQPGPVRSGNYHFDIGSAGSATLVIQTILPALFLNCIESLRQLPLPAALIIRWLRRLISFARPFCRLSQPLAFMAIAN